MQDSSSAYYHSVMTQHQFPEQEQLKCPRCDSPNTKFCYYNNYNLSQPRHFCKSCRRYWTKGGTLRNIPIGGASRKSTKRPGSSNNSKKTQVAKNPDADPTRKTQDSSSTAESRRLEPNHGQAAEENQDMKVLDMGGSFSSLLESSMQLGGILNGLNEHGQGLNPVQSGGIAQNFAQEGFLGHYSGRVAGSHEEGDYWGGIGCSNRWPDLAINTNGPRFHQRKI